MIVLIAFLLILAGLIFGCFTGSTNAVTGAILAAPADAVQLILKMCGTICLFCGLMRVAEGSGIVRGLSSLLRRPVGVLVPASRKDPEVREQVTMNLASNFFGLGNAATPYGIRACGRMGKGDVSRSLASFVLLNTCSVQLIPTTVCALRQAAGAENAMDILPAVWIVQLISVSFGLLMARIFFREEA